MPNAQRPGRIAQYDRLREDIGYALGKSTAPKAHNQRFETISMSAPTATAFRAFDQRALPRDARQRLTAATLSLKDHAKEKGSQRMSASRRFFLQAVLGGMVAATLGQVNRAAGSETFSVLTVIILSGTGPHRFHVELAESSSQRRQGLQGRRRLDANAGMLFVFEVPSVAAMWMKNTYIPLDMLFLDSVGSIVAIAENTQPMSLQPIQPAVPVKAVLELNAGTAARLGIKLGDRVLHPLAEAATSR